MLTDKLISVLLQLAFDALHDTDRALLGSLTAHEQQPVTQHPNLEKHIAVTQFVTVASKIGPLLCQRICSPVQGERALPPGLVALGALTSVQAERVFCFAS